MANLVDLDIGGTATINSIGYIVSTARSVGIVGLTGHVNATHSGTYTVQFGALQEGHSDDYDFSNSPKGITLKKSGWYMMSFTDNWFTCSSNGRIDVNFPIVSGGSCHSTIFQVNSDNSYHDRNCHGFVHMSTAPQTVSVTLNTTFNTTTFWHGCGHLKAYRLT